MMRHVRRFAARQAGAATLEAALWVPAMILVTMLAMDAVFITMNHARLQRVMDEGNRAFSVGRVDSCAELLALIADRLGAMAPTAVPSCSTDGTYVTASVTVSAGDLDLSGASGLLDGLTVRARSEMTAIAGVQGAGAGEESAPLSTKGPVTNRSADGVGPAG